ncbi:class I SAM-dependent methyltransferase [Bdellovibrio sp. 22V]|uniref:class I SAM-dependent methyltransferase n=1 Tax=Bdellovibrio TaxID=958 RepID=UPI0025439969|nr:class I SAM-dependent methyltransferase [Bdellovibrio sp. 22V]WII72362.1 class I SAM-dependent methyltransferase [Bdellovibrio sp. 22V]
MKAQYQTFINNHEVTIAGNETFNNVLALNGLCERDAVRYLQMVVHDFYPQTFRMTALDLGAGRGVTAMTLAELGFNVVAYDMYRNSIAILQRIALQQDLNISFGMGGILHLESLNKKFDLINDCEGLTNLVKPEDRARYLEGVKNSLAEHGKFVMTVQVQSTQYTPEEGFESVRLDENHVLWRETPECDVPGVVEMNGKYWTAQKRICPADEIRREVMAAGYTILSDDLEILPGNNPAILRLVLTSTLGC